MAPGPRLGSRRDGDLLTVPTPVMELQAAFPVDV